MTIAGMTARDSISLELDRNGRVVIPKDADFTDTESTLTYDLDSSSPRNGVACIRYTYNGRQVGFVYLCSSGMESSADPMAAAATPPQAAAGNGNHLFRARTQGGIQVRIQGRIQVRTWAMSRAREISRIRETASQQMGT